MILKLIKKFFKRELTSIIAPLDKIHTQLDTYLDQTAKEIADNLKRVNEINIKNEAIKVEQTTATLIKTNLRSLLGKI